MKAYRIKITSWTASFRYPNIISGVQPTLTVPPVSTVLGLMNACAGKYIEHKGLTLGYYFSYGAKTIDLETIYQVELDTKGVPKNKMKSNVIRREILYDCTLFIYLTDAQLANLFLSPCYPVLMGRSSDLATIEEIKESTLNEQKNADKIKGQVIPFQGNHLPGILQALPVYFTNTIPRQNIGTQAYSIISYDSRDFQTPITAYRDCVEGEYVDIYFHQLNFSNE